MALLVSTRALGERKSVLDDSGHNAVKTCKRNGIGLLAAFRAERRQ